MIIILRFMNSRVVFTPAVEQWYSALLSHACWGQFVGVHVLCRSGEGFWMCPPKGFCGGALREHVVPSPLSGAILSLCESSKNCVCTRGIKLSVFSLDFFRGEESQSTVGSLRITSLLFCRWCGFCWPPLGLMTGKVCGRVRSGWDEDPHSEIWQQLVGWEFRYLRSSISNFVVSATRWSSWFTSLPTFRRSLIVESWVETWSTRSWIKRLKWGFSGEWLGLALQIGWRAQTSRESSGYTSRSLVLKRS